MVWAGDRMDFVASVVAGVAALSQTMEDGRTQMVGLMLPSDFIGRPGRVMMLERLITFIRTFPEVWFATGAQVATYWVQTGPEHRDHHPELQRALALDA